MTKTDPNRATEVQSECEISGDCPDDRVAIEQLGGLVIQPRIKNYNPNTYHPKFESPKYKVATRAPSPPFLEIFFFFFFFFDPIMLVGSVAYVERRLRTSAYVYL
jgi:hypothetical protein